MRYAQSEGGIAKLTYVCFEGTPQEFDASDVVRGLSSSSPQRWTPFAGHLGCSSIPRAMTTPTSDGSSKVTCALGVSHCRIPQMLKEERKCWKAEPAVQALRDETIDLLASMGRVASADEIADALAVRRGTHLAGREQPRAMALAAVRAVVEVEQLLPQEAEFQHQASRKATDEPLCAGLRQWPTMTS